MICQVLTALHAIAAPLCVRPGTRAKPENIFIPGGARHARWGSFPKTMVGATFAKSLFASLRLTSGQLTCPKRRKIGKVCSCSLLLQEYLLVFTIMKCVFWTKLLNRKGSGNFDGLSLDDCQASIGG